MKTKLERNSHVMQDDEDGDAPLKSTATLMPSKSASILMHSDSFAMSSGVGDSTVDVDSPCQQPGSPLIRNEASALKSNKRRKKTHHRVSASRVASSKETDRTIPVDCRSIGPGPGSHGSPVSSGPVAVTGFRPPKQLSGRKVIAVSGLSAVFGVFCGLLIGGLFTDNREDFLVNLASEQKLDCEKCSISENGRRMILSSIWAQKYEELVIENAELLAELRLLDARLTLEFHLARSSVAGMKKEFVELDNDVSELEKFSVEGNLKGTSVQMFPVSLVHLFPISPPRSCVEPVKLVKLSLIHI